MKVGNGTVFSRILSTEAPFLMPVEMTAGVPTVLRRGVTAESCFCVHKLYLNKLGLSVLEFRPIILLNQSHNSGN